MRARTLLACAVTIAAVLPAPRARAFVTPRHGQTFSGGCPSGMARIEGGTFPAGSTGQTETIAPFCLDRTEVTVDAYGACVRSGHCNDVDMICGGTGTYGVPGKEKHPVNCATWTQMRDYCAAMDKRLPTGAEWEWAARGGPRGYRYPWGDDEAGFDDTCHGTPSYETCPVGQHAPNVYGLFDLSGNVWEWTESSDSPDYLWWFGGSYGTGAPMANQVHGGDAATWRDPEVGFRCAR